MANPQDASIGIAVESTYKTGVTPTRWFEFTDESLNWEKNIKQGEGLRVGSYLPRSARRVVPSAAGGGDFTVEAISKGLGILWQACLGTSASNLVSGSTYQQVHTYGALSSYTIQKGIPEVGGTVDPYTFLGCMVDSWELAFPNADLVTLKTSWDIGDLNTATGYTSPTAYPPATAALFHHANLSIASGTLTAPTTTALASGTTTIADVRAGSIQGANNLAGDRYNAGGAGRKSKPVATLRGLSGSLTVEYDATTWRDAVLNETPMNLILTWSGEALSSGNATLQAVIPEIKFDSPLSQANGTGLITTDLSFQGLDNLTASQPLWIVTRTSDSAV